MHYPLLTIGDKCDKQILLVVKGFQTDQTVTPVAGGFVGDSAAAKPVIGKIVYLDD